jgi:hypothetical protein
MTKLKNAKSEFFDIFLKDLGSASEQYPGLRVCDVYTDMVTLMQKIRRLRSVIEPEIQLSKSVHPETKVEYVAAKSFWWEDDGSRVRKFTKSLGRLDYYKGGINDPELQSVAYEKIREAVIEKYRECYAL